MMKSQKLFVATRNAHKLDEILAIFNHPGLTLLSMRDVPDVPDVAEDGDTFEANARKKAVTLARFTGGWALGDDSGLEVEALGGAPGVYSARYAGEPVDVAANNAKLLSALVGRRHRRAHFCCVLALANCEGACWVVEGRCSGHIAEELRGRKGFGYDPLFIPDGHSVTFAELAPQEKNRISHRAVALHAAWAAWGDMLVRGEPGRGP